MKLFIVVQDDNVLLGLLSRGCAARPKAEIPNPFGVKTAWQLTPKGLGISALGRAAHPRFLGPATLSLLLLASLAAAQPPDPDPAPLPRRPLTRVDCEPLARLTPDQLRERLGPPPHVSRQLLYHRYIEQWTYDQPWRIKVEIDYPRGRPLHLTVQPLGPP